jgi:hypothetical protein
LNFLDRFSKNNHAPNFMKIRLVGAELFHADGRTDGHDEAKSRFGLAMAQAVSRRPPTAEARVRSRVSPCGICGEQSGTGTGFSPSSSVLPRHFNSTGAPLLGKGQKIIIIIFITGFHNKPHGCSASVASAAGRFTTKKKRVAFRNSENAPKTGDTM